MIVPNTSKLLILLLNIYFNMVMVNPYLDKVDLINVKLIGSEVVGFSSQSDTSPEAKIDILMHDYINSLAQLKNTKDETNAIKLMNSLKKSFIQRAHEIQPELKAYLAKMSAKEAAIYKDKLVLKPYFKTINDLTLSYTLLHNVSQKLEMKQAFESMNEFMTILYK